MSLLLTFKETSNQLLIARTLIGLLMNFLFEIIKLLIASLILFVPNLALQEIHETLVLLKALPLLVLPSLIKATHKLISGERFLFDKQLNQLTKNNIKQSQINTISRVVITYEATGDDYDIDLILEHTDIQRTIIFEKTNSNTAKKAGLRIAQFLTIECLDNFPLGPEVLWGAYNVSKSDVDHIVNAQK